MSKFLKIALALALPLSQVQASLLQDAALAAGIEASYEVSPENIWAIEVIALPNSEAQVSLLSRALPGALTYDCHLHGAHMACHEDGHHLPLKELSELNEVSTIALARLEKTLRRRALSLADLDSYKVWKLTHESKVAGDDHAHEDFWLRASVQGKSYIQQCHVHSGESDYSCHYKSEADVEDEPQL